MDPNSLSTEVVAPAKRSKARSHLPLDKRQFYHSQSGQPMSLEEVMCDRDSEDEVDNDAAHLKDPQMLDDSLDDNENVEKFMQLWNSFVKKQRVLADAHYPWACEAFSRFHKKELHTNSSLNWCWRLFMMKLWKYGLVDAATITKCNTLIRNYNPNSSDSVDDLIDINNMSIIDETTQVIETASVSTEVTTQESGIESTMCRNGEKDEMEQRESAPDTESSQDVDTTKTFQRSFGKRPIKLTPKMKEMIWITDFSRGSRARRGRGREGRGGRGRQGGSSGNLII